MATVINTGLTTAALKGNFFSAFKTIQPVWKQLATVVASTGPAETYKWLGTVPQMRPWGTGRLAKGLRSESYSVENHKYEATLEVDRDELADDQLGQIVIRVRELARRAATHPDKLLAEMLANGAAYNGYDNVTFFSENHVSGDSGNQSNIVACEAATPATPTDDEFAAGYKTAVERLLGFKDDQGEPMNTGPGRLVVLVPANLWYPARQALNAAALDGDTNILAGEASIVVFPRLAAPDTWYLVRTDVEVRPFIFQDREKLDFSAIVEGSEEAFKREKFLYGVRARYALAYGYWQHCLRAQFV